MSLRISRRLANSRLSGDALAGRCYDSYLLNSVVALIIRTYGYGISMVSSVGISQMVL